MHFSLGKWFKFTEGKMTGLLAVVTDVMRDNDGKIRIYYDLIGDGRSDEWKQNVVYEGYTFDTDQILKSMELLTKNEESGAYGANNPCSESSQV